MADLRQPSAPEWAAPAASALALVAATVRLLLPQVSGLVPTWFAVVAAAFGTAVSLAAVRPGGSALPPRAVVAAGWVAVAALVLVAAEGIAFDVVGLLMWAIETITGEIGPVSLGMDWVGFATRVLALIAGALVGMATLRYQRRVRGSPEGTGTPTAARWASSARWASYAAAVLALGYGALKAAWGFGSDIGLADPDALGAEVTFWTPGLGDTVVLSAIGVVLALALVQRWGRRIPRWMLLAGAYLGAAMLIPVGLLGSYVTFAGAGRALDGGLEPWVTFAIYPWFLAWGLALGAAAWSYQYRTRR